MTDSLPDTRDINSPTSGPTVSRLGHVGIYVNDLEVEKCFYRDLLGLTVTDEDTDRGMVFLSARPDVEHHELLLARGRNTGDDARHVQQISFCCESLDELIEFSRRFQDCRVTLDMTVSHGNAIGIYFYDPEGNRCEVYWKTGLRARQPFLETIDLSKPSDEILAQVHQSVAANSETGLVEEIYLKKQHLATNQQPAT